MRCDGEQAREWSMLVSSTTVDRQLLDEQIAYYRARAAEYDEWFLRAVAMRTVVRGSLKSR